MILRADLHSLLVDWIERRPILFPTRYQGSLPAGFVPQHLDCYGTARAVHAHAGLPVIAGIKFLDKHGKLFPWPHMVNALGPSIADGLVDASPIPDQPDLGFVAVRLNETIAWNDITAAYRDVSEMVARGPSWGCSLADDLTYRFIEKLRAQAACSHWSIADIAIPDSIPKAS